MATFSKKMMGKEVGDAKVYAKPHSMSGGPVTDQRANRSKADTVDMSVGNISRRPQPAVKTTGIKMRGSGAATKGFMSRGPMA
jgi:hypothetical protein